MSSACAPPRSAAEERQIACYGEANAYLNEGLIRTEVPEGSPSGYLTRREWMSAFLAELGHPQRAFGAVHVAGTSGKGSVATMIAELLHAAGVRCGLHVSPYLQVATEKLWVDGRYASGEELGELVRWIRPHAEAWRSPRTPLHGMAWVAITLEHFRRRAVQLGVVEVGVGGRSDLTNVLDTRVAVITSVGLDHIKTLGPTLEQIARHKVGIIRPGCRAVVLEGPVLPAARRQAALAGAPLRVIGPADYRAHRGDAGTVRLDFHGRRLRLCDISLAMRGSFQAENAALALAALEELEVDGLNEEKIRGALLRARLPGRVEHLPPLSPGGCPAIVDGAHNPDKLAALEQVLLADRRRLHLVYGSLEQRSPDDDALRRLARRCATFVATEPRVHGKAPRPAEAIAATVRGSAPDVAIERDARDAVKAALARAAAEDLVVVTGSLYLAGEARGLWYDDRRVLIARSSY